MGRSWHTLIVKPGNGCGFAPAMSADSVAKWNWMSGVAASRITRVKRPPWLMPIASGPRRRTSHFNPICSDRHHDARSSLVVIGFVQR